MILRVFALFLSLQIQIFGAQYNSTIIELEARLFPKMLMLSSQEQKNLPRFEILILSKEHDTLSANLFKEAIQENYAKKIMGKQLRVEIAEFKELQREPDGIIVLYHSKKELKAIATWANEKKIPSFSYDPAHLECGILGSLYIGALTKPYLNKAIIKKYGFKINPYLLQLSKFY